MQLRGWCWIRPAVALAAVASATREPARLKPALVILEGNVVVVGPAIEAGKALVQIEKNNSQLFSWPFFSLVGR